MEETDCLLKAFGDAVDEWLRKSEIGMLVTKEAGDTDWHIKGGPSSAVLRLYILLHGLGAAYDDMIEEAERFGKEFDEDNLAETIGRMVADALKAARETEG